MPGFREPISTTESDALNDYGVLSGSTPNRTVSGLSTDSDYQSVLAGKSPFLPRLWLRHRNVSLRSDKSRDILLTCISDFQDDCATIDEDSPWYKKSVLSLDGGGIRGYSSLLILKELMRIVARLEMIEEPTAHRSSESLGLSYSKRDYDRTPGGFRLCHYFDYISGTSTGGLLAILLGRLRLDIDAVEKIFLEIHSTTYDPRSMLLPRSLADRKRREASARLIRNLQPAQANEAEDDTDFRSDTLQCRTIVCSMRETKKLKGDMRPFLFRSYEPLSSTDTPFSVAEVVRATVATSSYFEPVRVGESRFVDAATTLNNPSLEVLKEVNRLHRDVDQPIHLFVSLGSGSELYKDLPDLHSGCKTWDVRDRSNGVDSYLSAIADLVHWQMCQERNDAGFTYLRFNVTEGLHGITSQTPRNKHKSSSAIETIRQMTRAYLTDEAVLKALESVAQQLVDRRRQRAKTQRWAGYAIGTRWRCMVPSCDHKSSNRRPFPSENALMDHFERDHAMAPMSPQNEGRIRWLLNEGRTSIRIPNQ